jgi:AraC-like DNA-binding protein
MHGVTQPSSLAPGIQAGSRPSAAATLRLAANEAPEHQRPALLSAFFERMGVRYDTEPTGDAPVEIDLTVQALPGLQLMSGQMLGARVRRIRESNDPTDDVGLIVNPAGHHLLSQRGREIVLGDGEATLVSLTDTLDSTHRPPGDLLVLRFPRPQLAPRLASGDFFLRRIPHHNPALRLLTCYIDVASQRQALADRDLQPAMVSHLYDLMAVTIGATRDAAEMAQGGGLRAARLHAVKRDIAANLDQSDLSVAALARRHGCTPRYIQRLFESEDTSFTDHVLVQRLACAHGLLTDPRHASEKISTIALDAGFGDVSYFNRAFRQRYGDTPSAIRILARQA